MESITRKFNRLGFWIHRTWWHIYPIHYFKSGFIIIFYEITKQGRELKEVFLYSIRGMFFFILRKDLNLSVLLTNRASLLHKPLLPSESGHQLPNSSWKTTENKERSSQGRMNFLKRREFTIKKKILRIRSKKRSIQALQKITLRCLVKG